MNVLIAGASGFIGNTLRRRLTPGHTVVGTTIDPPEHGLLRWDIACETPDSLPVQWDTIDSVVVTAGLPGIDYYFRHPEASRKLTEGLTRFFSFAAARDIHLVFLSTDYVYGGTKSPDESITEQTLPFPSTEYGRAKLELEHRLRDTAEHYLIVRLSKNIGVVPGDGSMFTQWAESALRGESFRLATDQIFCVTWVEDTARALRLLIEQRAAGTFVLSAPDAMSRHQWGRLVCETVGADPALALPCSLRDFSFSEPRPLNLRLDATLFTKTFHFRFTPLTGLLAQLRENFR